MDRIQWEDELARFMCECGDGLDPIADSDRMLCQSCGNEYRLEAFLVLLDEKEVENDSKEV